MLHAILELDRSLVYIYFPPSLLPIPIHPRPSFPTPAISLHLLFPSFSHFVNQLSRSSAEGTTRREEKQDVDSGLHLRYRSFPPSSLFLPLLFFFFSSLFLVSFFLSFFLRASRPQPLRESESILDPPFLLPLGATYLLLWMLLQFTRIFEFPPSFGKLDRIGRINSSILPLRPSPPPSFPRIRSFPDSRGR